MDGGIDMKAFLAECVKEVNDDAAKAAKSKIKAKLTQIAAAEKVVANLRMELDALTRDIASSGI